jgi:hypothetical protein
LADRIDWDDPNQTQPSAICAAIQALPQAARDHLIVDFERVEQLCDPMGQRALHSVAATKPRLTSLLQSAGSDEARGIAVLLEGDQMLERSLVAASADRLQHGRSWSEFHIEGEIPSGVTPDPDTFQVELANTLAHSDGLAGKVKVDSFQRDVLEGGGTAMNRITHYAIYRQDEAVSGLEFQGNEIERRTRHPVQEILYDASRGSIDVMANGGKPVRTCIAESFAKNILCLSGTVHSVEPRTFALNRLRQRIPFDVDPADGIKAVKLTLLRLARSGAQYERVSIEVDPAALEDMWARCEQV